jgi:hypothetical protein
MHAEIRFVMGQEMVHAQVIRETKRTDGNQTTKYSYDLERLCTVTRDLPGTTDQVTTYQYANDQGISLAATWTLDSNDLLAQVDAPLAGSSDLVRLAYNRQAEQTARVDQAGNVINTDNDLAGRLAAKRITNLVSGFDGAVRRVNWTYNDRGPRAGQRVNCRSL